MTISDLREAMNMDMEVSFDYKGINYFIEPDAKSDKWMIFCSLKPDVPSFMTMNAFKRSITVSNKCNVLNIAFTELLWVLFLLYAIA